MLITGVRPRRPATTGSALDSDVVIDGMLFVQFYPEKLTSKIAELEAARLKELGREVKDVRETTVSIYRLDDGFSISVPGFEFRKLNLQRHPSLHTSKHDG